MQRTDQALYFHGLFSADLAGYPTGALPENEEGVHR